MTGEQKLLWEKFLPFSEISVLRGRVKLSDLVPKDRQSTRIDLQQLVA